MGFFNLFKKKCSDESHSSKKIDAITIDHLQTDFNEFKRDIPAQKQRSLLFEQYDYTVAFVPRAGVLPERIEIQLPWNLKAVDFKKIFHTLQSAFGDPVWYSEYNGFVWKISEHYLSFGFVEINFKHSVLMIRIQETNSYKPKIDYSIYRDVVNIFEKTNLISEETHYAAWFKSFGFSVFLSKINQHLYSVNFKNNTLDVTKYEVSYIKNKLQTMHPVYQKKITVSSLQELETALTELVR